MTQPSNTRTVSYRLQSSVSGVPGLAKFAESLERILGLQERLQAQGDVVRGLQQQTVAAVAAAQQEAQAVRQSRQQQTAEERAALAQQRTARNEYVQWWRQQLREQDQLERQSRQQRRAEERAAAQAERQAAQEQAQRLRDHRATMQLNLRLAAEAAQAERERSRASINALDNEMRAYRNLWQARQLSNDQVIEAQRRIHEQALLQAAAVDKTSDAYRRLTQIAAGAQRTIDQAQGINTPGGFAFGITQGITQALGNLGPFGQLLEQIISAGMHAAQEAAREGAQNVGRNAAAGLSQGLNSQRDEVTRAAMNTAKAVKDGAEEELDIHSPSRVMRRVGEWAGEGLADGLLSKKAEVAAAAKQLANAAETNGAPHLTPTVSGGGVGGVAVLPSAQANLGKVAAQAALTTAALGGTALAVGALAIGFVNSAQKAAQFEQGLAEMSLLTDKLPEQMGATGTAILKMTTDVGRGFEDLRAGYEEIMGASVRGTESDSAVLGFLRTSANLAKVSRTETKVATDALSSLLNAYELDAGQATRVSEMLWASIKAGKVSLAEAAGSLGAVAGQAKSLNVPLDQLLAAMALLTTRGIPASTALEYIRSALSNVQKPSDQARETAKALGIEFSATALKSMGLVKFLDQLGRGVGDNSEALATLIGDVGGLQAVLGLLNGGLEDTDGILGQVRDSTGALDRDVAKLKGTAVQNVNEFHAAWDRVQILFGTSLLPAFTGFLNKGITPVLNKLGDLQTKLAGLESPQEIRKTLTIEWGKDDGTTAALKFLGGIGQSVKALAVDYNPLQMLGGLFGDGSTPTANQPASQALLNHYNQTGLPGESRGTDLGTGLASQDSIQKLNPAFQTALAAALFEYAAKNAGGLVPYIHEGYRSNERQAELYAQGRTKPGKIITNANAGQSLHNYGVAVDVYWKDPKTGKTIGFDDPRAVQAAKGLGAIAMQRGLLWGGSPGFGIVDMPHIQEDISWQAARAKYGGGRPPANAAPAKSFDDYVREAQRLTDAVKKDEQAGDKDHWRVATAALERFRDSGDLAAQALAWIGTQSKESGKKASEFGQQFDRLKRQLDITQSLDNLGRPAAEITGRLESIRKEALAGAQAEKSRWGETAKYKALLDLAGDAAKRLDTIRNRKPELTDLQRDQAVQRERVAMEALEKSIRGASRARLEDIVKGGVTAQVSLAKWEAARKEIERRDDLARNPKLTDLQRDQQAQREAVAQQNLEKAIRGASTARLQDIVAAGVQQKGDLERWRAADAELKRREQLGQKAATDDKRNREQAAQQQLELGRALREGRVKDAERLVADLKRQMQDELDAAGDNLTRRAEIVDRLGPQIVAAERRIALRTRDVAVKAAQEWADGENAKAKATLKGQALQDRLAEIERVRVGKVRDAYADAASAIEMSEASQSKAVRTAAQDRTKALDGLQKRYREVMDGFAAKSLAGTLTDDDVAAYWRDMNGLFRDASTAGLQLDPVLVGLRTRARDLANEAPGVQAWAKALADAQHVGDVRYSNTDATMDYAMRGSYGVGHEGYLNALAGYGVRSIDELEGINPTAAASMRRVYQDVLDQMAQDMQDAADRAVAILDNTRAEMEAIADQTAQDADRALDDKNFGDRETVRDLGTGGAAPLTGFLAGEGNAFFGERFWTDLGEQGREDFRVELAKLTPEDFAGLGSTALRGLLDGISNDPDWAELRGKVQAGLTLSLEKGSTDTGYADLGNVLEQFGQLDSRAAGYADTLKTRLLPELERIRDSASDPGLRDMAEKAITYLNGEVDAAQKLADVLQEVKLAQLDHDRAAGRVSEGEYIDRREELLTDGESARYARESEGLTGNAAEAARIQHEERLTAIHNDGETQRQALTWRIQDETLRVVRQKEQADLEYRHSLGLVSEREYLEQRQRQQEQAARDDFLVQARGMKLGSAEYIAAQQAFIARLNQIGQEGALARQQLTWKIQDETLAVQRKAEQDDLEDRHARHLLSESQYLAERQRQAEQAARDEFTQRTRGMQEGSEEYKAAEAKLQADLTAIDRQGVRDRIALQQQQFQTFLSGVNELAGVLDQLGGPVGGAFLKFGAQMADVFKRGKENLTELRTAFSSGGSIFDKLGALGNTFGVVSAAVTAVFALGDAIENMSASLQKWKQGLLDVANAEKQFTGKKVGLFDNPYADELGQDAANREKLANSKWYQRGWWRLTGQTPQVMSEAAAKLKTEAARIFADLGESISNSLEGSLMDAFLKADFSNVEAAVKKSLDTFIVKTAIDTLIAKSNLKNLIEKYSDDAAAGLDTSGDRAAIDQEIGKVNQQFQGIAPGLPGYGSEANGSSTSPESAASSPVTGANFIVANSSKIDLFDTSVTRLADTYARVDTMYLRHEAVIGRFTDTLERLLRDGIQLVDGQGNYRGAFR